MANQTAGRDERVGPLLTTLLPSASAATRATLIESARLRSFRRRDTLLAQGAEWEMALILDGRVAVRRLGLGGHRFMIAVLGPGHLAGASAASLAPAFGESVALTAGSAVMWSGPLTRRLASADAGLSVDLIDRLVLGIGMILERYDSVTFEGTRARLCRVLLTYGEMAFDPARPVLSRGDLAALVGTSREMVNRVLRELEARGAVHRTGSRGLVLQDAALLQHVNDQRGRQTLHR